MRPAFRAAALALAFASAPALGADLPFAPAPDAGPSAWLDGGGGGFRVARVPVRPAPLRYDVYGYPLLRLAPSPLASGACPAALQPDYDAAGNLAGYAPIPMCR